MLHEDLHSAMTAIMFGNGKDVDPLIKVELMEQKMIDKDGMPTTYGWHSINLNRYMPRVRVPEDWEIETWKGAALQVEERHDGSSTQLMCITFDLNIYQILKFYQDLCIAQNEYIADEWNETYDVTYEDMLKKGHKQSLMNQGFLNDSLNPALKATKEKWKVPNTFQQLYFWGKEIYKYRQLKDHRWLDMSLGNSMRTNTSEVATFKTDSSDVVMTGLIEVN